MKPIVPHTFYMQVKQRLTRLLLLAPLIIAIAVLSGCAANPVTGERQVMLMSEQDEISAGRKADEDVKKEYGVYNNQRLQAYVSEVGMKMAKLSHRTTLPWQFTVVDSSDINAFALPGGFIYITRGLMAYLESEAELAGVLGHEIGHVTAKHGAARQSQGTVAQGASVLLEVLGQVYGGFSGAGNVASGIGQGIILRNGREAELQADELGAEYLSRTGHDPKSMISVIRVLRAQEQFAEDQAAREGKQRQQRMPTWLSTHPSNDQRLGEITKISEKYKAAYGDPGRDKYLRMIDGMTFGDSSEQGVVRGNQFYHEGLGFALTAPVGWKIQNSPEQLLVVNPEGTAGVIMQLATGQGNNAEDIVRKVLKPTQGNFSRDTVNSFSATYFSGARQAQQGQAIVEAAVIRSGNQDFLFALVGKGNQDMQRARPDASQFVRTFRSLTPQDKAAAKPYVLRTVNRAPLSGLAQRSPVSRDGSGVDRLRLLNGVYPNGEPSASLVKTVE
jgi:predicted Zn-dependent protease